MQDDDWFPRTLALTLTQIPPAVATRLARGDADDAFALWEAWRVFGANTPEIAADARAGVLAAQLRRGVERVVCAACTHVAWVAAGSAADIDADGDRLGLAWQLLADDMPLTESVIRAQAGQPGQPLVVERARAGGARLTGEARGLVIMK